MSLRPYTRMKESGIEWLGEVPHHWRVLPLARVTVSRCDGPFGSSLKSEHYTDEGARVIRLQNIRDGKFDSSDEAFVSIEYLQDELEGHDVIENDVLIAGLGDDRNTVGRACVAPSGIAPALVKADCFRFRLNLEIASPQFIALFLTSGSVADAGLLSSGSTRSRISMSTMATRRVALPPLPEQHAIATFLDRETAKIDALVAEQERLIALLAEKRRAVISHAVTKGLDPNAPMKDSGIVWLGEVPAHWEVKFLKRLASIRYGIGEPPAYVESGIPLIRATNVHEGLILNDGLVYVDPSDITPSRIVWLRIGDIIVVRSGAYTGDSAIVRDGICPAIAGFDMVVHPESITPDFLQYALLSKYLKQDQIDLKRARAAQPHLNAEELGSCGVLLPPLSEQLDIVTYLDRETSKLDTLTTEAQRAIALLKERRAALISAAVTGKIDVRKTGDTEEVAA